MWRKPATLFLPQVHAWTIVITLMRCDGTACRAHSCSVSALLQDQQADWSCAWLQA